MAQLLIIIHILASLGLIGLILIQQGKGAMTGAAFGAGASATVFGSKGSGSFLFKLTGSFALVFFITSLALGYVAAHHNKSEESGFHLPASLTEPVPVKSASAPEPSNASMPAQTSTAQPAPVKSKS